MNNYFFEIGIRDNTSHKPESRHVNNISLIIKHLFLFIWCSMIIQFQKMNIIPLVNKEYEMGSILKEQNLS